MNQWALSATLWHYYSACPHQQGPGPPPFWPYLYGHTGRSPSSVRHQFHQWHHPSRASIISPTTKHCFGQGQSLCQHFPYQWADSPMQPCRDPTIQLRSTGTSTVFPGPGPQQHLKPLHQTFLTQFPSNLGTPALGHHLALNQQQHPQATVTIGLPRATQHNTMDGTFYSRSGQATLPAMGSLPYSSQTATSAPSMPMDIATMAKVNPKYFWHYSRKLYRVSL